MTYEPHRTTEREVVVTPGSSNSGGMIFAAVLVVLAILGAIWLFGTDGDGTTGDTTSPVETTAPVETTIPTETTIAP